MNSTKHFKKKFYQFSIISFRRLKQREYLLTHSMRPALPSYQNQKKKNQINKKTIQQSLMNIDAKIFNKNISK